MKQTYFKTIAVLLLLVTNAVFAIPPEEREALIKLYHATSGEQWNRNDNWLGAAGSECNWEGVNCTDDGLNVRYLLLKSNNLKGQIPAEIGQLFRLEDLILEDNQLTSLPAEIGQLSRLRNLNLDNNRLTSLPAELGQLFSLNFLHLVNNRLTSIPVELGQLSNLLFLNLVNNQLTSLPIEIGQLSRLELLDLGNNQLTSLPDNFISRLSGQSIFVNLTDNCFDDSTLTLLLLSAVVNKPTLILGQQRTNCDSSVTYFNEQTGIVTLTKVVVGEFNYHAELRRLNENQFQLGTVFLLISSNHEIPAHYDFNTLLLEIPSVFAYGQNYRVQMKNDGTAENIFTIRSVTVN